MCLASFVLFDFKVYPFPFIQQAKGNSSTTSCYVQDPRLQTNESASCAAYSASSMYIKGQLVSPGEAVSLQDKSKVGITDDKV